MSNKTWNQEQEEHLRYLYVEEQIKDVHELAAQFGKGYRSVISKLVQLKIYEKPVVVDDKGQTVKAMLRIIEKALNIELEGTNLNKKENLERLVRALDNLNLTDAT